MDRQMTRRLSDTTPEEWDVIRKNYKTDAEEIKAAQQQAYKRKQDYNKQYNNVHSPAHYNQGQTECIDAIEAMLSVEEYIGYLRGNSMKYRWRFRYKNGFEDLNKAQWYEKRLVKFMEDHDVLGSEG